LDEYEKRYEEMGIEDIDALEIQKWKHQCKKLTQVNWEKVFVNMAKWKADDDFYNLYMYFY